MKLIIPLEINPEFTSLKKIKYFLIIFVLLSLPIIFLLNEFSFSNRFVVLICFLPLVAICLFNFEVIFSLFIISLFVNYNISFWALSEIFSFFVVISFFITQQFQKREFQNPLTLSFIIFILTVLPSYFNSINLLITSVLSLHLVAFFFMIFLMPMIFTTYEKINKYLKLFLTISVINGIYLIYLALESGKRVFGFAGIMYVDYVGIALVISVITLIHFNKRMLYLFITTTLLVALIFTQTRNSWLSSGLTIVLILVQTVIISAKLEHDRKKIVAFIIVSFVFVFILAFALVYDNSRIFARFSVSKLKSASDISSNLYAINSFATRYFI
ncbi:MAG: hypothetical protein Q8S01_03030, partial [Ignavibacteria bacterium]|nr:hypothetical protein [Ignavibacteria bacterium]